MIGLFAVLIVFYSDFFCVSHNLHYLCKSKSIKTNISYEDKL